jgi:hypothetical protein
MNNKFDKFPIGKERKNILKINKKRIADFEVQGKDKINNKEHYHWINSHIDGPTAAEERGGEPFSHSFIRILTGRNLKSYIQKTIETKRGEAIGVEFGGIGSNLFAGFSPGFFAKSFGVTLVDHRKPEELALQNAENEKIHHEVLIGDIFDEETYKSLNKKLAGAKVDFIVSRMAKGLEFVPMEPYTVSKILKIWYDLLNEGGIMLVQTPTTLNNLLKIWAEKIFEEFSGVIEIRYDLGWKDSDTNCSSFSLHKLPGAPKDLPLLDPKTVRKTSPYIDDWE